MKQNPLTRRRFVSSAVSLAGASLALDSFSLACAAFDEAPAGSFVADRMRRLEKCHARFLEAGHAELVTIAQFKDWQKRYDRLVGAADAVRAAIDDDTPGRDALIKKAKTFVEPSCARAILYWRPIEGMSRPFGRLAYALFGARRDWVCSIAHTAPDPDIHLRVEAIIEASRAVRNAMPVTRGDRMAMRRVIETFNNDDMVDVSIARACLEEHQVRNFRDWARSCGSFTCEHCEAWLGQEEELS